MNLAMGALRYELDPTVWEDVDRRYRALISRVRGLQAQGASMHAERMYLYDRLAELDPAYAASKRAAENPEVIASLRDQLRDEHDA